MRITHSRRRACAVGMVCSMGLDLDLDLEECFTSFCFLYNDRGNGV